MSKILISAHGSHGDLWPMIGLASKLKQRGHDVEIIANPHYQNFVEQSGLRFLSAGSAEKLKSGFRDRGISHPRKGFSVAFRSVTLPAIADIYRHVERQKNKVVALIGTEYDVGIRTASEKFGMPLASVVLQPDKFRSKFENAKLPSPMLVHWKRGPGWWKRLQFWMMDRFFADPLLREPINKFRLSVGLRPANKFAYRWSTRSELILAMFPDWYASPQPDWPAKTVLTGFPLAEQRNHKLDVRLEEFLDSGEPPVIFTPGSFNWHNQGLIDCCIESCRQLDLRGIIVSGRDIGPLPDDRIVQIQFAPFDVLFKRAAAVVHHAGIGTTSIAFSAGIPQLVIPGAFSSGDTAWRLTRLGAGLSLSNRRTTNSNMIAALSELLSNDKFRRQAQDIARTMSDASDPFETAVNNIEEMIFDSTNK